MLPRSPLEKFVRRLFKLTPVILVFFIGLTVLVAPRAIKLMGSISTELSKLLPSDEPAVVIGNEIKKKFKKKGGGDIILLIESPDPVANRRVVEKAADFLEKIPEVERVKTMQEGYDFFDRHKLLYLELEDLRKIRDRVTRKIQQEKLGGLYIDFETDGGGGKDPFEFNDLVAKYQEEYKRGIQNRFYASEDETVFALWIYPRSKDSSLSFYRKFFQLVSGEVKKFPWQEEGAFTLHYAGSIKTRIDEYVTITNDLKRAGFISVAGIFLLLIFYFRSLSAVVLMFLPLSSGIFLGFAVCSTFISSMNVVTSFLFSILFGLGIDIGIHMYARLCEERAAGTPREEAYVMMVTRAGRSSSVAVITTCATFFILIINDFRGFSEFGWIAGIGLMTTLVTYLLFFPAVLIAAERLRLIRFDGKRKPLPFQMALEKISAFPKASLIAKGSLVVMVLSIFLVPFSGFEWNYDRLKIHLPETDLAREKLKLVKQRVNSPATIIIGSEEEARVLKAEFERIKKADVSSPTIDKFRSSYDLFPEGQEEKMALLRDVDHLLKDDALNVLQGDKRTMVDEFRTAIAKTAFVKREDIPPEIEDAFYGRGEFFHEQVAFVYPLPKLELGDGRNAVAFAEDVYDVDIGDRKFHAVSDAIVFGRVLTTLFEDSKRTILLSIAALIILIYLDFRHFKKSALVMGTLAFGMLTMIATIVLFGWRFNFYSMITIPMAIGMGEDNSVHLVHRFEELKRGSVMKALSTSGTAALMASLTTLLGYSGLLFAHHPGLKSIGLFSVVGISTCLFASLIFLPAVLQWKICDRK